jgi:RND family efflux transporter MFP subunit
MRNFILLSLISAVVAIGCAPPDSGIEAFDLESIEGIKSALKQKTDEVSILQTEIKSLTAKLQTLDPTAKKPKVPVEVSPIEVETFESYSTFQANVTANDLGMASSETGGRITSLTVGEGDYVKAGQLIATVDLETIEKQKLELQTSLSLARTVYERQERLWKQNIGSELQYLEAKNNKERIEQSLKTFDSQLAKKNVYAPISGVIDMVSIKQGEMAGPGAPIVMILNTSQLKIEADIPEKFLSSVKRGNTVDVYFPALDIETRKSISSVGRRIDPANRTFKVEMNTSSMGGKIKPNLLAEVTVKEQSIKDVISIPVNLLQQEVSGENFVYIEAEGLAAKRKVVTGLSNDNTIIIEDGLTAGDNLIRTGAIGLSNGAELLVTPFVAEEEEN